MGRKEQFNSLSLGRRATLQPSETLKTTEVTGWYHLITSTYSRKALTKQDDTLPAVEGMAMRLSKRIGSKYLHGHFEHDIIPSLMWSRLKVVTARHVTPKPAPLREHGQSSAPSWSWASVGHNVSVLVHYSVQSPPAWPEIAIAQYHGSASVVCPVDRDDANHNHTNLSHMQRTQIRLSGFMFETGESLTPTKASIWRLKISKQASCERYEYIAAHTLPTPRDATQHNHPVSTREQRAGLEMKPRFRPDRPQLFDSRVQDKAQSEGQFPPALPPWAHDLPDLPAALAETPHLIFLYLTMTPIGVGCEKLPGLGGLVLEKIGDEADGPICRRLGTFYQDKLDFGLSGEELAELIRSMEQSTVYVV